MTAMWTEPTDDQREAWEDWKADPCRPADLRAVAERFDPWTMYRLKTTGQRCGVTSFYESSEGQPVTLGIYAEHAVLGPITGVGVSGIDPDDLEPWDGEEREDWEVERRDGYAAFRIKDVTFTGMNPGESPEVVFWGEVEDDKETP